ncbi:MAG TPA: ABC transporter ATP-binding protein [Gammaproteobacteria bacterium]|nr:ABC transporter ATP-binding protein [Gammaproteobacteria bacterium]
MNLPTSNFAFIFYFVRQQWLRFLALFAISMVWAVNDAMLPYFLKRIVNTLHDYTGPPQGVYLAVKGILIILLIFWIVTEILNRIQGINQIYTFPRFRANIRASVFNYVKSHSHEYFSNQFAGNLAKKLADLPHSCQNIMEIISFQFITATVGISMVLTMMWLTKPLFAVILLIWLSFHLGLTILILRRANVLYETHAESVSVLSGKIVDIFTNILNVRLFARSRYESEYLQQFQQDEITKARKAMWLIELMRMGLGINGLFLIFGMIFTLLYGWAHGWVTLGDFTQVSMQSFWLLGLIWFVSFQMTVFVRETGTISDALSLIKKSHDLSDTENAHPIAIPCGQIIFNQVTFGYKRNRPIFQNLNLVIQPGEKIGLVGFSGSGKSTLVNLILRFYDLQSGQILIDGQDIAKVSQESLRAQIAMIPQDPALFHRSLMENIRYGRLDATDEEVFKASELAHCHEFIEKLDCDYESLVGERGIKLSGGQRQRIAIARAILKNAPILILDEATSSLDSVTEKLIQESLEHLMQGRTTIVIAHRLSTLADMDRILVFHKGEIVEQGTIANLLNVNGHFAKLWHMQSEGFLPES